MRQIKDILVHIDNSDICTSRLVTALQLAKSHQAHLSGLYVFSIPTSVMVPAGEPGSAGIAHMQIIEAEQKAAEVSAEKARQMFVEMTANSDCEWRCQEGDPVETVTAYGRCFDLIIIGQTDTDDPGSADSAFVEKTLLEAGRPVLVMPYIGTNHRIGKRVIIAWDGSRPSARALNDGMPLLSQADAIEIVVIDSDDDDHHYASEARMHLQRHDITADIKTLQSDDLSVEDALLSYASDYGAGLLIMGAYGHSRLKEMILGGTTKGVLRQMTLPVLMSH